MGVERKKNILETFHFKLEEPEERAEILHDGIDQFIPMELCIDQFTHRWIQLEFS